MPTSQADHRSEITRDGGATGALVCPACGYNLFGLSEARCPECGAAFSEAMLAVASMIPWGRRRSIGVMRAYGRTVVLATFRPSKLGAVMEYPVRWPDARGFRWMTILIAFLPVAAAMGVWRYYLPQGMLAQVYARNVKPLSVGFFAAPVSLGLTLLAVLLFLYAASGVTRQFFYRRSLGTTRQSRAAALSYYAVAPMAFAWAPLVLGFFAGWLLSRDGFDGIGGRQGVYYWNDWCDEFHEVAIIVAGVFVVAWLRTTLVLMHHATGAGSVRLIVAGLVLPVAWVVIGAALFVGVHVASGLVAAVLASLR